MQTESWTSSYIRKLRVQSTNEHFFARESKQRGDRDSSIKINSRVSLESSQKNLTFTFHVKSLQFQNLTIYLLKNPVWGNSFFQERPAILLLEYRLLSILTRLKLGRQDWRDGKVEKNGRNRWKFRDGTTDSVLGGIKHDQGWLQIRRAGWRKRVIFSVFNEDRLWLGCVG